MTSWKSGNERSVPVQPTRVRPYKDFIYIWSTEIAHVRITHDPNMVCVKENKKDGLLF